MGDSETLAGLHSCGLFTKCVGLVHHKDKLLCVCLRHRDIGVFTLLFERPVAKGNMAAIVLSGPLTTALISKLCFLKYFLVLKDKN